MDQFSTTQIIAAAIIPIIFAITLHEAAHGYVAMKLGDRTAYNLGRVSLNPLRHISIIGTIIVPLIMLVSIGFVMGWAKPVPVNSRYFKKVRRDMALVALAGPLANLLMALFWACIFKLAVTLSAEDMAIFQPIGMMGQAGIIINLVLMVLNMLPIPPLDGSKILSCFLPAKIDEKFHKYEMVGWAIILVLFFTGVLSGVLQPILLFFHNIIRFLFGF